MRTACLIATMMTLCLSVTAQDEAHGSGRHQAEVRSILTAFLQHLDYRFKAKLNCPVLKQGLETEIAAYSPVPIPVSSIYATFEAGMTRLSVELASIPSAFRRQLEAKVNNALKSSRFGRIAQRSILGTLYLAADVLRQEPELVILKETEQTFVFEARQIQNPLLNQVMKPIDSVRMIVDRERKLVLFVRFNFTDETIMAAKLAYQAMPVPHRFEPALVPVTVTNWQSIYGDDAIIPPKFTITLSDFVFAKRPAAE